MPAEFLIHLVLRSGRLLGRTEYSTQSDIAGQKNLKARSVRIFIELL